MKVRNVQLQSTDLTFHFLKRYNIRCRCISSFLYFLKISYLPAAIILSF